MRHVEIYRVKSRDASGAYYVDPPKRHYDTVAEAFRGRFGDTVGIRINGQKGFITQTRKNSYIVTFWDEERNDWASIEME